MQKDSLDGTQSIINANLKKAPFANWKLREFMDAGRWKVVQDWLVNELTEHGRAVFPASAGTGLGTDFGTGLAREPFLCSSHGVIGATFLAKRSASASERQARALIWNCP